MSGRIWNSLTAEAEAAGQPEGGEPDGPEIWLTVPLPARLADESLNTREAREQIDRRRRTPRGLGRDSERGRTTLYRTALKFFPSCRFQKILCCLSSRFTGWKLVASCSIRPPKSHEFEVYPSPGGNRPTSRNSYHRRR